MRSVLWAWIKGVLISLFALLLLLAVSGLVYQYSVTWQESRRYPGPGKLVGVDGHRMHLYCTGSGSPTVVLEAGLGGTWMDWSLVQPEAAKRTRVCSYDRAGMGWSEPGPRPRVSSRIASELDALLTRGGEQPPYILVGHSVGGYHVRVFFDREPTKVAGMVLVDAAHEEQLERLPPEVVDAIEKYARLLSWLKYSMHFALPRLLGLCGQPPPQLERLKGEQTFNQCRASLLKTIEQELQAVEASAREVGATAKLGDLPLVVLMRDLSQPEPGFSPEVSEQAHRAAEEMQEELRQLSSRGRKMTVAGSGHYIQLDRPEVVLRAIEEVTEAARGGGGG